MNRICSQCSAPFEITPEDLDFYEKVSPEFGGKKYAILPPTLCPDCRFQRRQLFRNERFLYHRKSDLTGKQIVSIYAADKPYKVYDQDEFWSDQWDDLEHGRPFDFSRTFTEQFRELGLAVPHMSLFTTNVENSYYTNHALNMRNCYLLFGGGNSDDCMFGRFIVTSKDTLDGLSLYSCEWCYEGVASQHCYKCLFFMNCRNCSECLMVQDCSGCKNCCLCVGLQNREYCFLNEQLKKEDYENRMKEISPLTRETVKLLQAKLDELRLKMPHRSSHIYSSENCTGDMIFNSKNCHYAFDVTDGEASKFQCYTPKSQHSYDCTYTAPEGVQWTYEAGSTVGMTNGLATFLAWYGDNVLYSRECHHCSNVFGCISLKRKKYCILNTQYTKEEYEKVVPKIIEHMTKTQEWGEYLNPALSYMGYNETVAHETSPLTKEEALKLGFQWYDDQEKKDAYMGPEITAPTTIDETKDDICTHILHCDVTGKPYKIIPQELKFYREMNIPIPRKCPDQRHKERMAMRNPRKLWSRTCAKCLKEIQTTYHPSRPEIVYCESCYLKTVY